MNITIAKHEITVDSADAEWVANLNWTASRQKNGRVYFQHWEDGTFTTLHRMLANATKDDIVDHIDNDTLNNTRSNLRCVTRSENALNCGVRKDSTSGYRGVSCRNDGRKKKWRATATYNNHTVVIGAFYSPEEAAKAYDTWWRDNYPDVRVYKNFDDIV